MNRSLTTIAALVLPCVMELEGAVVPAASGSPEASLTLTVYIFNSARIPNWRLARIQKRVSEYFLGAGIRLEWVDRTPVSSNRRGYTANPEEVDPSDLILRIVPRFDLRAEGLRSSVFGFAAESQITIINERTEEVAQNAEATLPEILAIVIAHELGHALLGPDSHSENGIMRPRLQAADFKKAQRKTLVFTPEQAERMRSKVSQLKNHR